MTISSYFLHDAIDQHELEASHDIDSPAFLTDERRAVLEHYQEWFTLLRESGIYDEQDLRQRGVQTSLAL